MPHLDRAGRAIVKGNVVALSTNFVTKHHATKGRFLRHDVEGEIQLVAGILGVNFKLTFENFVLLFFLALFLGRPFPRWSACTAHTSTYTYALPSGCVCARRVAWTASFFLPPIRPVSFFFFSRSVLLLRSWERFLCAPYRFDGENSFALRRPVNLSGVSFIWRHVVLFMDAVSRFRAPTTLSEIIYWMSKRLNNNLFTFLTFGLVPWNLGSIKLSV